MVIKSEHVPLSMLFTLFVYSHLPCQSELRIDRTAHLPSKPLSGLSAEPSVPNGPIRRYSIASYFFEGNPKQLFPSPRQIHFPTYRRNAIHWHRAAVHVKHEIAAPHSYRPSAAWQTGNSEKDWIPISSGRWCGGRARKRLLQCGALRGHATSDITSSRDSTFRIVETGVALLRVN